MIICFALSDPQTSLYTCHVCNSNYNHSGNFKQHLLKHERESGSISATLVAQVGGNPHLTNVLQSAMTDRVDKCDRESEEKRNQYRCEHCGRTFKHPGNYKQHLQSHLKANGVKRSHTATSHDAANKLPRIESDSSLLGCPGCSLEFSSVDALQSHIRISHKHLEDEAKPALFKCDICHQSFRSEAFLNQHKLSFHKVSVNDTFDCNFCGKKFDKLTKLTQHVKIHSHPAEHYKYPCDICGKKFTRPHHVSRHKLLHTGENPFKCNQCDAAFPRVESLRTQ